MIEKKQVFNAAFRLSTLIVKFGLTLFMGRFFALDQMGIFGLVLGAVTVLPTFLGQSFGYVVGRDIVGLSQEEALRKMRDQALYYGANYVVLGLVVFAAIKGSLFDIAPRYLAYVYGLSVLGSLGTILYHNLNQLNRQLTANLYLLLKAALLVVPVCVAGLWDEGFRTADCVLALWTLAEGIGLAVPVWAFWKWPWRKALAPKIDWSWIRDGVRVSFPIWIGALGFSAGAYVDRYVVNHFLSLEIVGVLTFYASFTNAVLTLTESGVLTFASPRMVAFFKDKNEDSFSREKNKAVRQMALSAGAIVLGVALFVPLVGWALDRPIFLQNAGSLFLMLIGVWIQAIASVYFYVLFARKLDRALWQGNLIYLGLSILANMVLVAFFGLPGVGGASILSALALLGWRWGFVKRAQQKIYE